jgi:hypothetical protein
MTRSRHADSGSCSVAARRRLENDTRPFVLPENGRSKKSPAAAGLIVLLSSTRCIAVSSGRGAGKSFVAEKSALLALRRVASSRTHFIPAGTLGRSPAEPQGPRVHSRLSAVPDSHQMVWPPTRARVDAPSFFRYPYKPLRVWCLTVRFPHHAEGFEACVKPSKPNASAWLPRENRDLQWDCGVWTAKSVQSPDIPFM